MENIEGIIFGLTYRRSIEFDKQIAQNNLSAEVKSTLNELRRRNYRLAASSPKKDDLKILEHLGIIDCFDVVVDGADTTNSRYDPKAFLKAADMIHVAPTNCIVIADTEAGIDAANASGFHSAGLGSASKYGKAEHRISRFAEILGCL